MADDLHRLDACGQAALVERGEVTALELVEAALDRIERDRSRHAVTTVLADRARAGAGRATGPFAGVPILVKDAGQELAGTPMWMGTTVLRDAGYVSPATTELAARLEAAGFVPVGKAAVPELMTGISTEPPIGPPTANPWRDDLTAGGSSGGSAAAVAAGLVAVAHGSDSSGSLRYPASCCGVLTLKPSTGRVPARAPGGVAGLDGVHADFVLARSVADLRAVLAAVASASGRPEPARPEPVAADRGRIGFLDPLPFGLTVEPPIERAMAEVAGRLEGAGYRIGPVSARFVERYGRVLAAELPAVIDAHRSALVAWIEGAIGRPIQPGDLSPPILEAAARGRRLEAGQSRRAEAAIVAAADVAAGWVDAGGPAVDLLLLPILDRPPWPNGSPGSDGRLAGLIASLANFSGQPAVVVPTIQDGLPVGVQLQGPVGSDEALLDVLDALAVSAPVSPRLGRR